MDSMVGEDAGIGRESTWRFLELLTFASLSGRDVLKHSVLVAVLRHMHRKDKPMFLLDTHSSRGMFKLTSPEAMRSPEHLQGQPCRHKTLRAL